MQTFHSLALGTSHLRGYKALVLACLFAMGSTIPAMAEQGDSDPDGPKIKHVPVTAVARGVPVNIAATITPEPDSVLTSKVILVRLTDFGTPTEHEMKGSDKDNAYGAVLPISLFDGIDVFWYAIDARDDQGRIGGTIWIRVVIVDPAHVGAAALIGGGGGSGAGGGWGTAGIVAGGILLAGGTVAIIDQASDENKDDPPDVSPPEETGGRNDGDDDDEKSGSNPPACTGVTGSETVSYENLSLCGSFGKGAQTPDDIVIHVCYTCPNATISAEGSWEAADLIEGFNNPTCSPTAPVLLLTKPEGFPTPGTYTINVYANGILIDSIVWPPLSDFDCF